MTNAVLLCFAGRPGVGKTTLAKALTLASGAALLRLDTIEQALRNATGTEPGPAGYAIARALAAETLALGRDVIVDGVNPVAATRTGFAACARAAGARLIDVELLCLDTDEHRRRVETRACDIPGFVLPTWEAVQNRRYEPWTTPRIRIDTGRMAVERAVAALLAQMDGLTQMGGNEAERF